MKRLATLLTSLLVVAACKPNTPPPPFHPIPPAYSIQYSVEVHPDEPAEYDLAALKAVHWQTYHEAIRVDYVPEWGDQLFDKIWINAVTGAGLRIIFITPYIHVGEKFDADRYAALVAHGVGRYHGSDTFPVTWELQNEPNCSIGHSLTDPVCEPFNQAFITPEQYVQLVRAAVPVIRKSDPTAKVITGGTSGVDTTFLDAIREVYPLVDGIGVHPYGVQVGDLAALAQILQQRYNKPIYYTEYAGDEQAIRAVLQPGNGLGYVPLYNEFRK